MLLKTVCYNFWHILEEVKRETIISANKYILRAIREYVLIKMVYISYHLHKWLWVVFQDNIGRYLLVSILRVHEESDMGVKGGIDLRENAETTGTLGANNKADKEVWFTRPIINYNVDLSYCYYITHIWI